MIMKIYWTYIKAIDKIKTYDATTIEMDGPEVIINRQ